MMGDNQTQTEISENHPMVDINNRLLRASQSLSSLFIGEPPPTYDPRRPPRYEECYPSPAWPPGNAMYQSTNSRGAPRDLETGRTNWAPRAHAWRIAAVFGGFLLMVGVVIGASHIPSKQTPQRIVI